MSEWTGNAHLLCSACGTHDHKTMTMLADRFLCGVCIEALMAMVRERREEER